MSRQSVVMSALRPVALLYVLLCLSACSSGAPADWRPIRLIEVEPAEMFRGMGEIDPEPVFSWTFESSESLQEWQARNIDRHFAVSEGALLVRSSGIDPQIVRGTDFDAADIQVVRVSHAGSPGSTTDLFWAREGEPFDKERTLTFKVAHERTDGNVDFAVGSHPQWSGRIRSVRIDPTASRNQAVRIREIAGFRKRVTTAEVEELSERPWKVALRSEIRNALISAPGRAIERELVVPRDAELRFELGIWQEVQVTDGGDESIRFTASFTPAGAEAEVVFNEVLRLSEGGGQGGWHPATVDLSSFAGENGTLALEAIPSGDLDPLRGLGLWANPEVLVASAAGNRAPNIILISIDALRQDHVSLYGYSRETTPNIDAWARRSGVTFENAVAQAPWTLPSHTSMFSGLSPLRHGVNHEGPVPPTLTTVAEILRQAGYTTAALTGGGWFSPGLGFMQGFDSYRYWAQGESAGDIEVVQDMGRALGFLERNQDRPFFLFFHTYEVHAPFMPRQPFFSRFAAGDQDGFDGYVHLHPGAASLRTRLEDVLLGGLELRLHGPDGREAGPLPDSMIPLVATLYDSGIGLVDEQIGRLLQRLQDLDLEDNTIVVLTADHGEMLGEDGKVGHETLYEPIVLVPLVMAFPERLEGGQRIRQQVREIDILPTILELAGMDPLTGIDGESLVPLTRGDTRATSQESWSYASKTGFGVSLRVGNRWKYVLNNSAFPLLGGREELYNLDDDPGETVNLAAAGSDTEELRARAMAILEQAPGVKVRLVNGSASELRAGLQWNGMNPRLVKFEGPWCDCADWDWEEGVLRVAVPAGGTFTLSLEEVAAGPMSLSGSVGTGSGSPSFSLEVDPAELTTPLGFAFTGSDWVELEASETGRETWIMVWRQGDLPGLGAFGEMDEETLRRLRALGYIQ